MQHNNLGIKRGNIQMKSVHFDLF